MSTTSDRPRLPWWLEEGCEACSACATFHHAEACVHCAACDRPVCATCAIEDRDEPGALCPACFEEGRS